MGPAAILTGAYRLAAYPSRSADRSRREGRLGIEASFFISVSAYGLAAHPSGSGSGPRGGGKRHHFIPAFPLVFSRNAALALRNRLRGDIPGTGSGLRRSGLPRRRGGILGLRHSVLLRPGSGFHRRRSFRWILGFLLGRNFRRMPGVRMRRYNHPRLRPFRRSGNSGG
jgi:hypothetical protein